MAQFDRIYKITLGEQGKEGIEIEGKSKAQGLDIDFEISKTLDKSSNTCTLKIYNLKEATSKQLEKDDTICILEVGYSEDAGLKRIFIGWVTECYSYSSSADKITELKLYDGHVAIRDSVVSLSYADAVSRRKVIDDVAADMGLLVNYADDCEFTTLVNGFSFMGAGRDCLTKACDGSGLSWSIQNNTLQVIKDGGSTNKEAIKLTAESGLIGFVEKIRKSPKKANKTAEKTKAKTSTATKEKKAGWKLKCLLQPVLNPGDLVYVESKAVKGWFKIESLKHNGSYSGQNWYTEMEVYEIKGKDGSA